MARKIITGDEPAIDYPPEAVPEAVEVEIKVSTAKMYRQNLDRAFGQRLFQQEPVQRFHAHPPTAIMEYLRCDDLTSGRRDLDRREFEVERKRREDEIARLGIDRITQQAPNSHYVDALRYMTHSMQDMGNPTANMLERMLEQVRPAGMSREDFVRSYIERGRRQPNPQMPQLASRDRGVAQRPPEQPNIVDYSEMLIAPSRRSGRTMVSMQDAILALRTGGQLPAARPIRRGDVVEGDIQPHMNEVERAAMMPLPRDIPAQSAARDERERRMMAMPLPEPAEEPSIAPEARKRRAALAALRAKGNATAASALAAFPKGLTAMERDELGILWD